MSAALDDFLPYCATMAYAFVSGDSFIAAGTEEVDYPFPTRSKAELIDHASDLLLLPQGASHCFAMCPDSLHSRITACLCPGSTPLAQGGIIYPFSEMLEHVLQMSQAALTHSGDWVSSFQGYTGVPRSLQQSRRDVNRLILETRYGWVLAHPKKGGEIGWTDANTGTYMFYHVDRLMSGTYLHTSRCYCSRSQVSGHCLSALG